MSSQVEILITQKQRLWADPPFEPCKKCYPDGLEGDGGYYIPVGGKFNLGRLIITSQDVHDFRVHQSGPLWDSRRRLEKVVAILAKRQARKINKKEK